MKTKQLVRKVTAQGWKLHCLWCLCLSSEVTGWFTYDIIKITIMQIKSNWSQYFNMVCKILCYFSVLDFKALGSANEPKNFRNFLFEKKLPGGH